MSHGPLEGPNFDFKEILDSQIPCIKELAKNHLPNALEKISLLEKKTRKASDLSSTSRLLVLIVELCKDANEWTLMCEQVQLMSKRHGQFKKSLVDMIQEAIKALDFVPNLMIKLECIESLRSITEGKIFLEAERVSLTRDLAKIKEQQNNIKEAAELLCELKIETFGSVDKREKTEFILEQIRLCLAKSDYNLASIISRKISIKYFQEEGVEDLKLKYYELLIRIGLYEDNYLEVCKYYKAVYDTPSIIQDESKWKDVLQNIVYFIIISPYGNEQSNLLHHTLADPKLQSLPVHYELIKYFTKIELMRWPKIKEIYGELFRKTSVFDLNDEKGKKRWADLKKRIIEHNIRVVSKYYLRIRLSRLNMLLDLNERETEEYLSNLVTSGVIYARIDRPAQTVSFMKPKNANVILNEWSWNIGTLLEKIEKVRQMILKEEMQAKLSV
ncbi:hypothetical protein PNEG_00847 [Pneumocystis murina B123]|uniref:PCI domain-containing protein n=1 Tax=Pneumocystis murina (strain B123) TaxID=1069680 RepID=M7NUB1_PNEMU|nr:hypothetical protein PNEG_00847 [Pneumocystis murina B123]EMR10696.1 hypothetical protein PNEG_00847 [Pneumocystis murina B123]